MTLKEIIIRIVDTQDFKLAGRFADYMRTQKGLDYNGILSMVRRHRPDVTEEEWDALLYAADEAEGEGR